MDNRALGFLEQRHAHHAASRLTWVKRWLKRAYRHHAQSRELKPSQRSYRFSVQGSRFIVQGAFERTLHPALSTPGSIRVGQSRHEHAIEQPFELAGALGDFAGAGAVGRAAAKQLVR